MFTVTLTFKDEAESRLLWCQLIRARKHWRDGIKEDNLPKIMYGSSWTDALLDQFVRHASDDLVPPDGNETNKP